MRSTVTSVEIIAGTPPGGGQDRAARALAEALGAHGGVVASVSNVVGRGGGVGWSSVRARPGDASVVSISSPTLLTNHLHDPEEPGVDDLTHLGVLCTEPLAFVVGATSTIRSAGDLLTWLADGTGTAAIATALGNVNHLAVMDLADHVGAVITPEIVAHSSAVLAVDALADGADVAVVSAASSLRALADGEVRVVALSSSGRPSGPLADVPTWTEIGVPCDRSTWRGVVGPSDLGAAGVDGWATLLEAATATESWQRSVERMLWVPRLITGDAARTFAQIELEAMRSGLIRIGLLDG